MSPRPEAGDLSGPQKKILYVEDSDTNWELTRMSLGNRYELHRAINSTEAFSRIQGMEFDLVLMDIELADSTYNGIEITQILRGIYEGDTSNASGMFGKYKELPIVFVTAYSTRYSKDDLKSFGGSNAVYKPVDFALLNILLSNLTMTGVRNRLRDLINKD